MFGGKKTEYMLFLTSFVASNWAILFFLADSTNNRFLLLSPDWLLFFSYSPDISINHTEKTVWIAVKV